MKTTLLLLLFLVAHADDPGETGKDSALKCSLRTEAELGKDVTLDCYCEPPCDVTGEDLEWEFNQSTIVLGYRGTYNTSFQDDQFKGRAHVTSTERLKDGNFPVTISRFRKSDEGNYTCHVGSKTCSVELQLKAAGAQRGNTTTRSGGRNSGAITGTVVAVVVIAVIALLVLKI